MQSSTVKVVFILLISHALAFPSGAPQSACDTMMPGHVFRTQSVPCPFVTQPEKVNENLLYIVWVVVTMIDL